MSNSKHIAILLSTYNGQPFIKEQLDSIFQQSYQNFTIYVRDDASSDATVNILNEYKSQLSQLQQDKLIIIENPNKVNWGYMKSFWYLLSTCPRTDYYAFCDQDDIWLPNKLERGILSLEQDNADIPLLYSSRFDYYSGNLEFQEHGLLYPYHISFDKVAFYTPAFGFTIIINGKLREVALSANDLTDIPHDGWCQKIATAMGHFIYDTEITAKYRRHSSSVTIAGFSKFKLITKWIQNDILGKGLSENYWVLKRFKDEYNTSLSGEVLQFVNLFCQQPFSFKTWFSRLFYPKRLRPTLGGELALRICFLIYK